jgi:hypothetical protein
MDSNPFALGYANKALVKLDVTPVAALDVTPVATLAVTPVTTLEVTPVPKH